MQNMDEMSWEEQLEIRQETAERLKRHIDEHVLSKDCKILCVVAITQDANNIEAGTTCNFYANGPELELMPYVASILSQIVMHNMGIGNVDVEQLDSEDNDTTH